MLTLGQSAAVKGSAGEPLPVVWQNLDELGVTFRRGQLALVAAGPGTGKSAFVLSYALKAGVSCLYFSADSDAYIQLSRSLAIRSNLSMAETEEIARSGDYRKVESIIGSTPIRFSYHPSPTLEHIQNQVLAYEELYGDFPELIVIDNALDVDAGESDELSQNLDTLMAWLHDMARTTEACVITLHHVTGPYNDANKPIPLSGVKGQIGRVPELIITLHKENDLYGGAPTLKASPVKNRGQRADPSGETYAELTFDGFNMNITDREFNYNSPTTGQEDQYGSSNPWG